MRFSSISGLLNATQLFSKFLLQLLFVSIVASSCSTEKNAFLNRNYHYTTVKFNGYFNGNEAYKLAKKNIATNQKDDYDHLLDVFQYGNETDNKSEYDNLNRAITKGAKMIDNHSMIFRVKGDEVEANKMIDDCYLLIGKARFLKYDLKLAEETFAYIKKTYKGSKQKWQAAYWLILTYVYQENFVDAETLIEALKNDEKFPDSFKDELQLAEAITYKRSQQWDKAILAFEKSIKFIKKRKLKRRMQFILAQMYQQQGNLKKASTLYKIIAKKATNYDLQFNAKINLATTYDGSGSEVITILEKMLKDAKNKEYQDQIYFALAQVYERKGAEEKAIENYKLAAKTSVNNPKQKGKAFLALGNYYFDIPEYIEAANYYDSALIALPKDFPNYPVIKDKKESLEDLVVHLKTVKEQDSLLKVANMSKEELDDFIEQKIISAANSAEQKRLNEEAAREAAIAAASLETKNNSGWIFDNPTLLASANAEFKAKWGDRPLEDNWRRSDKTSVSFEAVDEEQEKQIGTVAVPEDQTADFYLKDLPFDTDAKAIANDKIKNAYYQLGVLYRDNFNDLQQSTHYFNLLNERYPKNNQEAVTLYQLYRNYDKMNKPTQRDITKEKVISDYPNSEYAQLLINPNLLEDEEKKNERQEAKYSALFDQYKGNDFAGVVAAIDNGAAKGSTGELKAKYDLLRSFALGNLYGKDTLSSALSATYQNNMGTEVANEVDLILGQIRREEAKKTSAKVDSMKVVKAFKVSSAETHYFVLIYQSKNNAGEELLTRISNFNKQFFSTQSLNIKSLQWDDDEEAIVVKSFKNVKEYYKYYSTFKERFAAKDESFSSLYFTISQSNYSKLFQFKHVLEYMDFFTKNYSPRG